MGDAVPHARCRDFDGRKKNGEPCGQAAGWGTAHAGTGKCKMHGGASTGPKNPNTRRNAVKHGAYETLMRERLPEAERAIFDAVSVEPALAAELRIVRYKILRLIGEVSQNVHGKAGTWTVKADDFEKGRGIALLVSEARKLVKEMQGGDLGKEIEGFLAGVQTIKEMQGAEDLSE